MKANKSNKSSNNTENNADKLNSRKENGDNYFKLNKRRKIKHQFYNKNKADDEISQLQDCNLKTQKVQEKTRMTHEKICEELAAFNRKIHNSRALMQLRCHIPEKLQTRLDAEAGELESLYAELLAALQNIATIRSQRAAVEKEKNCLQAQLTSLKGEALKELEVIVSVYDAPMMDRWLHLKDTNSVSDLDNFLYDVKGKLEAMKNLEVLAGQRISQLQEVNKEDNVKKGKEKKNKEEKRVRWTCDTTSDYNLANSSQDSQTFFTDTESEDTLDGSVLQGALYSLISDQDSLNTDAWADDPLDVD